jgi:hypothetical protein
VELDEIQPGEIISYLEMCQAEGCSLQRGMNFHLNPNSVILMSVKKGAPYSDKTEDNGRVIIYEGHDSARNATNDNPKSIDQPMYNPGGTLTQNGLFFIAASKFKNGTSMAELVRVYEKVKDGIWVYNGVFQLVDSWLESQNLRKVFKFKLEIIDTDLAQENNKIKIEQVRMIPTAVKLEVWKRDKGQCRICGEKDNLHFDHIIPYSKGGSSLTAENIQLLCVRHNLEKHDKIA